MRSIYTLINAYKALIIKRLIPSAIALAVLAVLPLKKSSAQVLEADSLALVALYNATNGANWTNSSNWLAANKPVSTWHGVQLFQGRVNKLFLNNNNLEGTLPDEIGDLDGLVSMQLQQNALQGAIPSSIGNLTSVGTFQLYENQFTSLPDEIGNLTNISILDMHQNELTAIPAGIGNLINLEVLNLENNSITTIPDEIGDLPVLRVLNLSLNPGLVVTDAISGITSLQQLLMRACELDGAIPSSYSQLTNLVAFDLRFNQLDDFLPVFDLQQPITILLASNQFTFADIQPNVNGAHNVIYSPQDSIYAPEQIVKEEGEGLDLDSDIECVGGPCADDFNIYTWIKNDTMMVQQGLDPILSFASLQLADSGVYRCEVINDFAPDLVIHRQPVTVTVNPVITGQTEVGVSGLSLAVFPNPLAAGNDLNARIAGAENTALINLTVFDAVGKMIQSIDLSSSAQWNHNISALSRGLYTVRLQAEKQTVTQKVIVQ